MPSWTLSHGGRVEVTRGDLTRADVDAIVNAANPTLLGGGGVDGAIHRAAGPRLLEACRALPQVRPGVRCPVGEARLTPGFDLAAHWVIHTVGPIYGRAQDPAADLASAHRSSLRLAREHGLASVAFPAISCGIYGYPPEEAAEVAIQTVIEESEGLAEVRFMLFTNQADDAWMRACSEKLGTALLG